MARDPINRSLETRVSLAEQRIDTHERECAVRYKGIEDMFKTLCERIEDRFDGLDLVIGRTEDEGLRKKVSSLNLDRAKWLGIAAAVGVGGGVLLTVVGWLAAPLLSSLF